MRLEELGDESESKCCLHYLQEESSVREAQCLQRLHLKVAKTHMYKMLSQGSLERQ